jgi:hypothetical protein
MSTNTQQLPAGYKPVDKTKIKGKLKTLSPLDQGLRSLLVKDPEAKTERQIEEKSKPPVSKVKSISDIISNNIQATTDLRTITHYIKRAEQIWTALLMKPNGDQRQLLMYDTESSEVKNGKLHELLLQKVENYFTTKFPFEELAPQIIKDVLFRTGSYVYVNMSHAVLDHLINGMEVVGSESFKQNTSNLLATQFVDNDWKKARNIGYIREHKRDNHAMEGLEALYGGQLKREPEYNLVHPDLNWTFTDNPVALKIGELAQVMREDRLSKVSGMEGINSAISNVFKKEKGKRQKVNNNHVNIPERKALNEALAELYPQRHFDQRESLSIRKGKFYTGNGRGIGIGQHWPSESAITVNVNGEIGKPFGVLLLTDPDTGAPLKTVSDVKFYQTTKSGPAANDSRPGIGSINDVIQHLRTVANGGECTEDMSWMAEFASATLEKEFVQGFLNGDLHKDVSISLTEENKKLFLSRALKSQGVRVIFIPSEYVTYVATDFNRLGTGRSLVDEAKLHITRLAVLDTASALAQVENSISHTLLEITPEEEDVDIRNTVSLLRDEWFSGNPTLHDILGYNNVSIDAILDRFKEQSLTVKVNATNNPHTVNPDISASQMEREPLKSIDPEARETLLNTIAGFFGLKRSWLEDTGEGNDFAIEALADQELLRNQTTEYSRVFSQFFSDIMRKNMRVNEPLIGELVEIIKENKTLYEKPDQTGTLEVKEETAEKINKSGDDDTEVDELEQIELVLKDFLNTFYVLLPTPAITDSLVKLEDKIEAVEKLVESWVNLGGGSKMMKRRAEEAGLQGDDIVENMKAILLNEAFERFNLPMPFEAILNKGKTGGMMTYINKAVDLDSNVLSFLTEWAKGVEKNNSKAQKLKERVDKANAPDEAFDEIPDDTDGEITGDGTEVITDEQTITDAEGNEKTEEVTENSEELESQKTALDDETKPDTNDDIWATPPE